MKLNIIFADDAIDILLSITEFIENKWTRKDADKFLDKVYKTLDLTSKKTLICLRHPILKKALGSAIFPNRPLFSIKFRKMKLLFCFFGITDKSHSLTAIS